MFWDDVTLERDLPPPKPGQGMRLNPYVKTGLDVVPVGGMKLKVMPGEINVDGEVVKVTKETVLDIRPPRMIQIRDEKDWSWARIRRIQSASPRVSAEEFRLPHVREGRRSPSQRSPVLAGLDSPHYRRTRSCTRRLSCRPDSVSLARSGLVSP